jgi:hypothetical protein
LELDMPRITQQKAPGRIVSSFTSQTTTQPNGAIQEPQSILDQAIGAEELTSLYIKFVVYGQNRVGKTHLACGFPKPLLLICFEPNLTGGAMTITGWPGIKVIKIKSSRQALQLAEELKTRNICNLPDPKYNGKPYLTHVLDSATSYQDIILSEILDLTAVPEQLSWGMVSEDQYRQRSEKTREALRPFLNLPAHTIITAKERDHNANKGDRKPKILRAEQIDSFFASDLGGATVGWLHDACDYIARLYFDKEVITEQHEMENAITKKKTVVMTERETGKIIRRLRTLYHPNYAAGFRSSTPEAVPEYVENPTWEKIEAIIKGKKIKDGKYTI